MRQLFGLEGVVMAVRCVDCYGAVLVEFHMPRSNGEVIDFFSKRTHISLLDEGLA